LLVTAGIQTVPSQAKYAHRFAGMTRNRIRHGAFWAIQAELANHPMREYTLGQMTGPDNLALCARKGEFVRVNLIDKTNVFGTCAGNFLWSSLQIGQPLVDNFAATICPHERRNRSWKKRERLSSQTREPRTRIWREKKFKTQEHEFLLQTRFVMKTRIPRTLRYQGRTINYTGSGRTAGSLMYLDAMTGSLLELYFARVERTGPLYSLARVANNSLGTVRIDHVSLNGVGPVVIGDVLIVGCLQYLPEGPRATAIWRAPVAPIVPTVAPPVPQMGRQFGVITWVHPLGKYGTITGEQTGRQVFVHHTQIRRGARLLQGLRVSYVEGMNPRGPAAFDVWPA
jgi:cold shock CspA family protein